MTTTLIVRDARGRTTKRLSLTLTRQQTLDRLRDALDPVPGDFDTIDDQGVYAVADNRQIVVRMFGQTTETAIAEAGRIVAALRRASQ